MMLSNEVFISSNIIVRIMVKWLNSAFPNSLSWTIGNLTIIIIYYYYLNLEVYIYIYILKFPIFNFYEMGKKISYDIMLETLHIWQVPFLVNFSTFPECWVAE